MSTQKSFLARLFSRKPKQASLPLEQQIESVLKSAPELKGIPILQAAPKMPHCRLIGDSLWQVSTTTETPAEAKETPRKRVPSYYIPTEESPWIIISHENGKWVIALYYIWKTRAGARTQARAYSAAYNVRTRVVRAIVPTR